MFISDVDGFYYQIVNVSSNGELGSLGGVHTIRYILVAPFFILDSLSLSSFFEPLLLFIYLTPIIFWTKIPKNVRFLSVLLLFLSLFFSYRVVLLMASVFILASFIHWRFFQFNYFLISMFFGLLSSGVLFVLLILFFYLNMKQNFFSKKAKRYFILMLIIGFVLLIPSVVHKLLFFFDPHKFGSATSVSIEHVFMLTRDDFFEIVRNMAERSLVSEAFSNTEYYFRIYIFVCVSTLSLVFLMVSPSGLSVLFFLLSLSAMLVEGLILYSLLFVLIVLNYDCFSRRVLCKSIK